MRRRGSFLEVSVGSLSRFACSSCRAGEHECVDLTATRGFSACSCGCIAVERFPWNVEPAGEGLFAPDARPPAVVDTAPL